MTVKCKKFRAKIPKTTCIARQKLLTSSRPNKFKGLYGGCLNCEIGLKLLKEDNKLLKEKTCKECGKPYPATLDFFDFGPRASDKLTNVCSKCRGVNVPQATPPPQDPPPPQGTLAKADTLKARKSRKPGPGQERKVLIINIESSPGLWDALVKDAKKNLRTPLAHALWILREELI